MPICPNCKSWFGPRKSKIFCSSHCRWDFHNKQRLNARRLLIEREIEHLESEGYEVKKKEV